MYIADCMAITNSYRNRAAPALLLDSQAAGADCKASGSMAREGCITPLQLNSAGYLVSSTDPVQRLELQPTKTPFCLFWMGKAHPQLQVNKYILLMYNSCNKGGREKHDHWKRVKVVAVGLSETRLSDDNLPLRILF